MVHGDFRQKEILQRWRDVFTEQKNHNKKLQTATFLIMCSSGTYIRELAQQIGKKSGSGALAFDIFRIKIGDYSVNNSHQM